jgi:hypothetical protein
MPLTSTSWNTAKQLRENGWRRWPPDAYKNEFLTDVLNAFSVEGDDRRHGIVTWDHQASILNPTFTYLKANHSKRE